MAKFFLRLSALGVLLTASLAAQTLTQIRNTGSRDTRVNVVFFGDGYTAAEEAKFQADAASRLQVMLGNESWSRFANYMNAFAIFTASNESGAGTTPSAPKDTYFHSTYGVSGIDRLLAPQSGAGGTTKVFSLLTQFVPEYDVIVMIVNATTYGGAGGTIVTTSMNSQSDEIVLHELGHGFALLTDEYVDLPSAPIYTAREYPNATAFTTRDTIPWRDFVLDSTPVPATTGPDENYVSIFLGALYRDTGWYRPTNNSKMRSLGRPFGPVNMRAFASRFHTLNLESATAKPTLSQSPAGAIVATGGSYTLQAQGAGAGPLTYLWRLNGKYLPTATSSSLAITGMNDAQAGVYSVEVTNARGTTTSADVSIAPAGALASASAGVTTATNAVSAGSSATLTASLSPAPTSYQWRHNITSVSGQTGVSLALPNVQPLDAGLYFATSSNGTTTSLPAIIGVSTTSKVIGSGSEFAANIPHQNGNIYDQVLLSGAAATITADAGQVTRISFIDLTNDIVQVEFGGAGTLTVTLDNASGPATAVNYNQPTVSYMKGHPSIVITGANETTNVSIFSVGRATAVNQALFRSDVTYDGMADVAFLAIASTNGKFGGVRSANASYFSSGGYTGIYAPGVEFTGPVFIGDISASSTAIPVIVLGSASDVRITGGDLQQSNHRAVEASGFTRLQMTAGTDSHGNAQAAQPLRARLENNGTDITAQVSN